jgi:hypothetical protein
LLESLKPDPEEERRLWDSLEQVLEERRQLLESVARSGHQIDPILGSTEEDEFGRTDQQTGEAPDPQAPSHPLVHASAAEVANWMNDRLRDHGSLYQSTAALGIRRRFGPEHVYLNQNRNPAISREVLAEFRLLTPDVVWERRRRLWRLRRPNDSSGRQVP